MKEYPIFLSCFENVIVGTIKLEDTCAERFEKVLCGIDIAWVKNNGEEPPLEKVYLYPFNPIAKPVDKVTIKKIIDKHTIKTALGDVEINGRLLCDKEAIVEELDL